MQNRLVRVFVAVAVPAVLLIGIYNIPFVNDHLAWRIANLRASIDYFFSPPARAIFHPTEQTVNGIVVSTVTPADLITLTPSPVVIAALDATATPTNIPTPVPAEISLKGVRHEYQKWNNCGPANLSMALSYWGWKGGQIPVASYTKPNPRDKNVMPYELADFVDTQTDFKAVVRVGGDLELLKSFLAAGFPVIVEKGFEPESKLGWMGHYEVITGYSDGKQKFTAQDSYIQPDLPVSYDDMLKNWRAFNYLYIVVYPIDREKETLALLGPQANETANFQYAATKASNEIYQLTDPGDQFFAWYNRGSSLVRLQDYAGAAAAYDQAYTMYPTIPDKKKPWRMLWYQTVPYFAYYYTVRYSDVRNLSTLTINHASEPAIEESFYWRGLAELALGDQSDAVIDFRESLTWHPNFAPTLEQLSALGVQP